MNIIFYKNLSPPETLNKNLEEVVSYKFEWKPSSSVLTPIIHIDTEILPFIIDYYKDFIITGSGDNLLGNHPRGALLNDNFKLLDCNYAYIPQFKRYYYITDLTSIRNNLWEISLQVDVLRSFRNEILNLSGIVARNEFEFNELLVDENLPVAINKDINTISCTLQTYLRNPTDSNYYISELANAFSSYSIAVIISNIDVITDFVSDLNNPKNPSATPVNTTLLMEFKDFNKFCNRVLNPSGTESKLSDYMNISDYIKEVKIIPYSIQTLFNMAGFESNNEWFGHQNIVNLRYSNEFSLKIAGVVVYLSETLPNWVESLELDYDLYQITTDTMFECFVPLNNFLPTIIGNRFTDYEPYSKYSIYTPITNLLEIDISLLKKGYNTFVIKFDSSFNYIAYQTNDYSSKFRQKGDSFYNLYSGEFGYSHGIGRSNQNEINMNRDIRKLTLTQNITKAVSSLAMGAAGIFSGGLSWLYQNESRGLGSLVTSSTATVAQTASSIVGTVTDYKISKIVGSVPKFQNDYNVDSTVNTLLSQQPFILVEAPSLLTDSLYGVLSIEDYRHLYGSPLNEYMSFAELSGMTVIGEVHLDHLGTATIEEINQIKTLLCSGVLFP